MPGHPIKSILIFIITLLSLTPGTHGQSLDHIRESGRYRWGIGTGQNYTVARQNALDHLSQSISVHIKSNFTRITKGTNDELETYVKNVVSSYSSTVVNRYEERVLKEGEEKTKVLVYIRREALQDVFDQRRQLIKDFIDQAVIAEKEFRIDDALRYYYWALILTRSHPDNSSIRHAFGKGKSRPVMINLYDRINRIFSFLDFNVQSVDQKNEQKHFNLGIRYRGKPVEGLDYKYWVGDGYSGLTRSRNGKGIAMLQGAPAKSLTNIRLRVEYQYRNKAHLEPEVKQMMENVSLPYFEKSEFKVGIKEKNEEGTSKKAHQTNEHQSFKNINAEQQESYRDVIEKILEAIQSENHAGVSHFFTENGRNVYKKLIRRGNVQLLSPKPDTLSMVKINDQTMVRAVPMMFAFENNNEKFIENVVFSFNEEQKIKDISFALSNKAISDILSKPEGFGSMSEKYFLIHFMETFKTAYALKRINFLETIFDDDALIIVGNVVKEVPESENVVKNMYNDLSNEQVQFLELSKDEYIERLRHVFRRNEFINIGFEENEVKKTAKKDKIYGIQIAQHYYSSTYADKGYLFLMMDLTNADHPRIYVRTWQPEKNPDGSVIGLEDFRF